MDREELTIGEAVGRAIRAVREDVGERQDSIAQAASAMGLGWARSTVTNLEKGRRALSMEEFLLLPHILDLTMASRGMVAGYLADLDATIRLTSTVVLRCEDLAAMLRVDAPLAYAEDLAYGLSLGTDEGRAMLETAQKAATESERRLARRLGVPASWLVVACRRRFGRSLDAERDDVVMRVSGDESPRRIQALRGVMTRELTSELEEVFETMRREADPTAAPDHRKG